METDLPEARGTYVLIAFVPRMRRLDIGRLGSYDIIPGFYAYVGSAFGSGGLRARLQHHLESVAEPHWHIDYLMGSAEPVEVWYALTGRKLVQDPAELLTKSTGFRIPIPRFGSSDYRRSRTSHLFYSKCRPSFPRFHQEVNQTIGEPVELHLCRLTG
jgi:Uri superfamily endonuclease